MSVLVPCVIILLLLGLNGVFVAAEFALVIANKQRLQCEGQNGNAAAARVADILADRRRQDRYVATAQLGITLASLALGMYGEHVMAEWIFAALDAPLLPAWFASHAAASVLAVASLTYLHIVMGEMIPKTLALAKADKAAVRLIHFMSAAATLTRPIVAGLNGIGDLLLRRLRLPRQKEEQQQSHSPEEIQYLVRESQEEGLLGAEAAEIIEDLIDFGQLTAGEVMVPRVHIQGIEIGADLPTLRQMILEHPHTRYPVYARDLDHIIGSVHIKILLRRIKQDRGLLQADIRAVPFLPETSTLNKVLTALRSSRSQIAVVMDEHGGTAGIVSIGDLFDEIVGDVEENAPGEAADVQRNSDGSWTVQGTVRLDELSEALGREIEREDVDTVSGLVLALLDRPPEKGDLVQMAGVRFKVLAVQGHGVRACRVFVVE